MYSYYRKDVYNMTEKQRAKLLEKETKAAEKLKKEIERTESLMVYERKFADKGYIAGIDEVGRGPLSSLHVPASFPRITVFST